MDERTQIAELERLLDEYSFAWEGDPEETVDLDHAIARWNGAWGFVSHIRFPATGVHESIDRVVERVESRNRRYRWVVAPGTLPADLATHLTARGFERSVVWDGLVLDDLTTPMERNTHVEVEELSEANVEEYAALRTGDDTHAHDFAARLQAAQRYLTLTPRHARISLARLGGRLAAFAVLRIEPNGVAYLRQGTTLPPFRGQGIYSTLVAHRIEQAREAGCTIALTQAVTNSSGPILRRLGFRRVCGFTAFVRPLN